MRRMRSPGLTGSGFCGGGSGGFGGVADADPLLLLTLLLLPLLLLLGTFVCAPVAEPTGERSFCVALSPNELIAPPILSSTPDPDGIEILLISESYAEMTGSSSFRGATLSIASSTSWNGPWIFCAASETFSPSRKSAASS